MPSAAENYTSERKEDDFQQLRLAALERLETSKGVPTVMLPGTSLYNGLTRTFRI